MENRVEIKQEKQIQHAIKTIVMAPSLMGPTSFLLNIDRIRTSYFEHQMNTLILAFNEWTSHIKPNRTIIRFTKSLIEQV